MIVYLSSIVHPNNKELVVGSAFLEKWSSPLYKKLAIYRFPILSDYKHDYSAEVTSYIKLLRDRLDDKIDVILIRGYTSRNYILDGHWKSEPGIGYFLASQPSIVNKPIVCINNKFEEGLQESKRTKFVRPYWLSTICFDVNAAGVILKQMSGVGRFPRIIKEVDHCCLKFLFDKNRGNHYARICY